MAIFVKLTNNRADLKGSQLYFNIDHIICMYDAETPENIKTFIYGGSPPQTWEIEESSKRVMSLIEYAKEQERGKNNGTI